MIDRHPLCPTAAPIAAALERAGRAARQAGLPGCARTAPTCPISRRPARIYSELLSAFFSADLPPAVGEQIAATARALSLGDDEPRRRRPARPDDQPSRLDSREPHPQRPAGPLAGAVPGGRCRAVPADADRGLSARPLAAIRPQLDVDGAKVPYFDQSVWAGIATLNGLPATTMPIGRTDERAADRRADHRRLPRRSHDDRLCRPDRARIRRLHPAAEFLTLYHPLRRTRHFISRASSHPAR